MKTFIKRAHAHLIEDATKNNREIQLMRDLESIWKQNAVKLAIYETRHDN